MAGTVLRRADKNRGRYGQTTILRAAEHMEGRGTAQRKDVDAGGGAAHRGPRQGRKGHARGACHPGCRGRDPYLRPAHDCPLARERSGRERQTYLFALGHSHGPSPDRTLGPRRSSAVSIGIPFFQRSVPCRGRLCHARRGRHYLLFARQKRSGPPSQRVVRPPVHKKPAAGRRPEQRDYPRLSHA